MQRILVTDADSRAALAITRSLGRAGFYVGVAHHTESGLASSSKYCRKRILVPDAVQHPDSFVDAVDDATRAGRFDAVIPVTDVTTLALSQASEEGRFNCRMCIPSHKTLELAADKYRILEIAANLDIPAPRSRLITNAGDLQIDTVDFPFPVVVKPTRSRVRSGERWISTSVFYANSYAELERELGSLAPEFFPLLLQERIVGSGVGVFACYEHGRPIAFFSHKRIREKPPSGGVSVLRESVPVDPIAGEHTRKLLDHLQWHGVAMVEYKLDERDRKLKIMEVNGRFWGSLQLAIDAGMDFPVMAAALALGNEVTPIRSYRTGIQSRWLWGDIDALLSLLFKSPKNLNLPPHHPGRWVTLLHFSIPWYPGLRYEVFSVSDFRPWLHETRRWLFPARRQ